MWSIRSNWAGMGRRKRGGGKGRRISRFARDVPTSTESLCNRSGVYYLESAEETGEGRVTKSRTYEFY